MKHLMPFLALLVAGALSGCSIWQQQQQPGAKEEETKLQPPQYLGTVHQVYASQKFALLRIIGPLPQAGTTLITHPVDGSTSRMGNLEVYSATPRNGMIAADIRSGVVASGDRVFLYRNIAVPEVKEGEKAAEPTEAPQPAPLSPVAASPARSAGAAPAESALPPLPEPTAAPETTPAPVPTRTESTDPLPKLPSEAPSYLKDIPDDVSQWN